jgi:hypothetical protein
MGAFVVSGSVRAAQEQHSDFTVGITPCLAAVIAKDGYLKG